MSILADSQIRDLCQLPSHITNFETYVKSIDTEDPSFEAVNGKSRLMLAQARIPDLNTFKLSVEQYDGFPEWLRQLIVSFKLNLEPYSKPPMIEPFFNGQVREEERRIKWHDEESETTTVKLVSYGLSSHGYDARLSREIKTFTNMNGGEIDPKNFDPELCVKPAIFEDEFGSEYIIVPSNGFVLGSTMEWFSVPRDVLVVCLGKSTYARTGLVVNVTPLEAEWEGNVTLELSNTTPLPIRVYLEEGICQFLFFKSDLPCDVSYADRKGKYQFQSGLTLPKV